MPNMYKRNYFLSFLTFPSSLISCLTLTAVVAGGCSSDVTRFSSNSLNLADNSLSSPNSSAHVKGPYSLGLNSTEPKYYSSSESFDHPITRVDLPPSDAAKQSGPSFEMARTSSFENRNSGLDVSTKIETNNSNTKDTLYNLSTRSGLTQEELIRQNSFKSYSFRHSERREEPSQKLANLSSRQGSSALGEKFPSENTFRALPQNISANPPRSVMSENKTAEEQVQSAGSSTNAVKPQKYTHTPLPLLPSEQPSASAKEEKLLIADLKQNTDGQKSDLTASTPPTLLNSQNLKEDDSIRNEGSHQEREKQEEAIKGTRQPVTESVRLRWPVKGRITSPFGERSDGTTNDGIDISVPLGTDIHAAEEGVVAYAGNQLPAYGNLVLIRHEKGVVTAYAHTDQIKVKRGDRVSRGQVIATAGKTGAVDQPKLHFEVREGAKAVDPLMHLEKI